MLAPFGDSELCPSQDSGGNLCDGPTSSQRRAWVYKDAARFGRDPNRIYITGHSRRSSSAVVRSVTDWQKDFRLAGEHSQRRGS